MVIDFKKCCPVKQERFCYRNNKSYIKTYSWLVYSESRKRRYCNYCAIFSHIIVTPVKVCLVSIHFLRNFKSPVIIFLATLLSIGAFSLATGFEDIKNNLKDFKIRLAQSGANKINSTITVKPLFVRHGALVFNLSPIVAFY